MLAAPTRNALRSSSVELSHMSPLTMYSCASAGAVGASPAARVTAASMRWNLRIRSLHTKREASRAKPELENILTELFVAALWTQRRSANFIGWVSRPYECKNDGPDRTCRQLDLGPMAAAMILDDRFGSKAAVNACPRYIRLGGRL